MDVITDRFKVTITAAIHNQGFIAAAEHVTDEFVPVIEADGVGALEPRHPGNQVGVGSFQHQMIVIAHQAIGMHLPAGLMTGFGQGFEEILPVHTIQEDVLATISATHDVVDRAGILYS